MRRMGRHRKLSERVSPYPDLATAICTHLRNVFVDDQDLRLRAHELDALHDVLNEVHLVKRRTEQRSVLQVYGREYLLVNLRDRHRNPGLRHLSV